MEEPLVEEQCLVDLQQIGATLQAHHHIDHLEQERLKAGLTFALVDYVGDVKHVAVEIVNNYLTYTEILYNLNKDDLKIKALGTVKAGYI